MKFLTTAESELKDSKLKLKVTVPAPTNAIRFALYDLGQNESLEGRIKMAEYIFDNCVTAIKVGAQSIEPEQMLAADLADDATSTIYFKIVDMVVSHQLNIVEDAEKKSA